MDEKFRIIVQGSFIRLRYTDDVWRTTKQTRDGEGQDERRGVVVGMSEKSRRRLLQMLAKMDEGYKSRAIFVTLTYGQKWPDIDDAKQHKVAFIKRVWRAFGECAVLWRLEFQKRGAPHFHLLMFGVDYIPKEWAAASWWGVVGNEYGDSVSNRPPFTRVEGMRSSRGTVFYMAKYVAKTGDGFNYVPYSAVSGSHGYEALPGRTGRVWGLLGRKHVLWAPRQWVELDSKTFHIMRDVLMDRFGMSEDEWRNICFSRFLKDSEVEVIMDEIYQQSARIAWNNGGFVVLKR